MDNIVNGRGPTGGFIIDETEMTVVDGGRKYDVKDITERAFDIALSTREGLSVSDVHIASALSGFITGFSQVGAIADIICPPLLVNNASDYYFSASANNAFRRANTLLASQDAEVSEVSPVLSSSTFTVKAYGLSSFVSQGVEANADSMVNPYALAMARIMSAMTIEREHRVQALLNSTSSFTGYTTALTSSTLWDGGSSSDPLGDIHTAIETALMPITHIAMSRKSWHRFLSNPQVSKYGLYATDRAVSASPAELASRLGLDGVQFVIGDLRSESTTYGTTTKSYIWDDDVFFLHIPMGADSNPEEVPTCRNFRWLKDGMARESGGFRVREWEVPGRGQDGGRKISLCVNEIETLVDASSGYFLANVW